MNIESFTPEITGYTRILRKALHISWKEHFTNKNVYGNLPLVNYNLFLPKLNTEEYKWLDTVYDILNYLTEVVGV